MGFLIDFLVPADDSVAAFENRFNGAGGRTNLDGAARLHFFAGADQAFPLKWAEFVSADELDFIIIGEKSGRSDFGVVEDQEVVWCQIGGEIGEHPMFDFAGVTVDHHHSGRGSVVEWSAGDEFFRELVVEVDRAQ